MEEKNTKEERFQMSQISQYPNHFAIRYSSANGYSEIVSFLLKCISDKKLP